MACGGNCELCKEYMLISDDDGHWYVIPAELESEFDKWVEDTSDPFSLQSPDADFEEYRIGGSPRRIKFKHYRST